MRYVILFRGKGTRKTKQTHRKIEADGWEMNGPFVQFYEKRTLAGFVNHKPIMAYHEHTIFSITPLTEGE